MSQSDAQLRAEAPAGRVAAKARFSWWKLGVAILLDVADFTIGRIFGLGFAVDVLIALIASALFGWKGLFALWELVDLTDQIDGFVPTATLIALSHRERKDL